MSAVAESPFWGNKLLGIECEEIPPPPVSKFALHLRMNWSLRDAHAKLGTAVRAAYAMPKDADILAFLLHLNQS